MTKKLLLNHLDAYAMVINMRINENNRKWWILAAMTSSLSMIFIDITVLPVALPTIQKLLNFSDLALQWIVNCYTLVLAVLVLAGGRLSDIFGPKRIFSLGASIFALASAFCGLSYSEWWFISSRILQGVGGALLLPSTSAIILAAFPLKERGKAMGISLSVSSLFLSIGPFVGGLLTQYLSWRYVFWMNLPIAITGLILAHYSVPKRPTKKERFDYFGFWTMSLGISAFVIGLMQADKWGWGSPLTLSLLLLGLILVVLLILLDRKMEDPFIDFKLFKNRHFFGSLFSLFCTQFIVMITVFWVIYFQNGLGFTPTQSGLLNLLANIPLIVVAPIGGFLLDRYGPKIPNAIGYLFVLASFLIFLQILENKSIPLILAATIPFGCGISLIFSSTVTAALSEVHEQKRGAASGLVSATRQLGATLGLAVFGALFLHFYEKKFSAQLMQNVETENLDPGQFEGLLSGAAPAVQALSQLPLSIQSSVKESDFSAYIASFSNINVLAAGVTILALITSLTLIKKHLVEKSGH